MILDRSMVVSRADLDFHRKLQKVQNILRQAGPDGVSRVELTRKTQRMLSCARERDDVLCTLEEAGLVALRWFRHPNGRQTIHYWAVTHAPREDDRIIGVWGEDQGW